MKGSREGSAFPASPKLRRASRDQGSVGKDEGGRRKDEESRVANPGTPAHSSSFILHLSGGWGISGVITSGALVTALVFCCVAVVRAQGVPATRPASGPVTKPAVRFTYVDVYIDSRNEPLAAYQLELAAEKGDVKIVGIEGGEHAAFRAPPYYDPAAMSRDHVIIAAFNTGQDLPKGETRVARVHVQITGEQKPEYVLKLEVAASSEGQPISGATAAMTEGGSR